MARLAVHVAADTDVGCDRLGTAAVVGLHRHVHRGLHTHDSFGVGLRTGAGLRFGFTLHTAGAPTGLSTGTGTGLGLGFCPCSGVKTEPGRRIRTHGVGELTVFCSQTFNAVGRLVEVCCRFNGRAHIADRTLSCARNTAAARDDGRGHGGGRTRLGAGPLVFDLETDTGLALGFCFGLNAGLSAGAGFCIGSQATVARTGFGLGTSFGFGTGFGTRTGIGVQTCTGQAHAFFRIVDVLRRLKRHVLGFQVHVAFGLDGRAHGAQSFGHIDVHVAARTDGRAGVGHLERFLLFGVHTQDIHCVLAAGRGLCTGFGFSTAFHRCFHIGRLARFGSRCTGTSLPTGIG